LRASKMLYVLIDGRFAPEIKEESGASGGH
jgi:hypothetical protein